VGTSAPLLRVDGEWYSAGVTVSPDSLPTDLAPLTEEVGGASQRFAVGSEPYLAVSIQMPDGLYVEVFPLGDLDTTFIISGWVLTGLVILAFGTGAALGRFVGARILRPLRQTADGARLVAAGDLTVRLPSTGDPDLDPIAESFNEMAEAVQAQISRERRFTANVSHELRSPLTSVLGTAELLERRRDTLPERDANIVDVLVRQVRRLSQMVLDLLEISAVTSDSYLQVETADVAALCREVLRDRGLDEALVEGDQPSVRTDARRFERIVGNLVDNAQRHGDGLKRIRVEREAGMVRIHVDDAGRGIEPEESQRLFEPFARGAASAGTDGAGLGLAIVREQARLLRAKVDVGPSPLGGARFTITLDGAP
jgi:signal transduction histidine kinase